jgi:hypothetical protein
MRLTNLLIPISFFTACCSVLTEPPKTPAEAPKRVGIPLKPVKVGELMAYAEASGRVRIPPRYLEAGPFEEGLAVVAAKTVPELGGRFQRRFGVIDSTGAYVIPPAFRYISHFREGVAIASLDGKTFGYIDSEGRWILPPRYAEASDFNAGWARVLPLGELSFAQVNTQGRVRSGP